MTPAAQAGRPCPHCPCFIRDEQSAAWGFVSLVHTGDPISAIRRATAA